MLQAFANADADALRKYCSKIHQEQMPDRFNGYLGERFRMQDTSSFDFSLDKTSLSVPSSKAPFSFVGDMEATMPHGMD